LKGREQAVNNRVSLEWFSQWRDYSFLLMRILLGAFLVWGVWDNIVSSERMAEFVTFLNKFGFVAPEVMARVSVWFQFLIGFSFIFGVLVRWFSVACIINFVFAIVMVDSSTGIRGSFPSALIIAVSFYFLTYGAGKISVDKLILKIEK